MYTANPPSIFSDSPILQVESLSGHSAVDIAADPTSDSGVGSLFLPVPPFFEQRRSPWTPDTSADSHGPQVNAEAGFNN
jgi:hypothetical protein